MIRRPPRSTRTDTLFPTRRSSDLIRIIREEDEPKAVMIARWDLTDIQAEAILNMRLRNLRKLEEFEIRKEFDELSKEKADIEALLARSEEHTSELQSLMRISYAVFCLKKK